MPLVMVPLVASAIGDAVVALERISKVLTAEELDGDYPIDKDASYGLRMDGDFTWESAGPPSVEDPRSAAARAKMLKKKEKAEGKRPSTAEDKAKAKEVERKKKAKEEKEKEREKERKKKRKAAKAKGIPYESDPESDGEGDGESARPFRFENLRLEVPRGSFVAIVGRVGSGKSSLLQAMSGEMRKLRGEVRFGGTVSYVAQTPWIQVRHHLHFKFLPSFIWRLTAGLFRT